MFCCAVRHSLLVVAFLAPDLTAAEVILDPRHDVHLVAVATGPGVTDLADRHTSPLTSAWRKESLAARAPSGWTRTAMANVRARSTAPGKFTRRRRASGGRSFEPS